jgi:hypothetical protein
LLRDRKADHDGRRRRPRRDEPGAANHGGRQGADLSGRNPSDADTRRPSVPSPIHNDVKEQRRTRSPPRAPFGTPGHGYGAPEPPSPDRRRRTPI